MLYTFLVADNKVDQEELTSRIREDFIMIDVERDLEDEFSVDVHQIVHLSDLLPILGDAAPDFKLIVDDNIRNYCEENDYLYNPHTLEIYSRADIMNSWTLLRYMHADLENLYRGPSNVKSLRPSDLFNQLHELKPQSQEKLYKFIYQR